MRHARHAHRVRDAFQRTYGIGWPRVAGAFFSCPLDEGHLWAAVRYVERNPVRAELVERAWEYAWSSASAHCGLREDLLLSTEFPPAGVIADWSQWLSEGEDEDAVDDVRQKTRSGRPCGSAAFTDRLEHLLDRVLHPQRRGPKPNKSKQIKKAQSKQAQQFEETGP